MSTHNHKQIIKQICDFMGEDLDAPACREVAEHLNKCPNCQVYLDTVKKTVTLCRELEKSQKVPEDVNGRLYKVLNLEKIQSRKL